MTTVPINSAVDMVAKYILWGSDWPPKYKDEVKAYNSACDWVKSNIAFDFSFKFGAPVELSPGAAHVQDLNISSDGTSGYVEQTFEKDTTDSTTSTSTHSKTIGYSESVKSSVETEASVPFIGKSKVKVEATVGFKQDFTDTTSKATTHQETIKNTFKIHIDLEPGENVIKSLLEVIPLTGKTKVTLIATPKQPDPAAVFKVTMNYGTITANLARPHQEVSTHKPDSCPQWKDEIEIDIAREVANIYIETSKKPSARFAPTDIVRVAEA